MYRTFIVDDEPSIRSGLRMIIPWEEYGIEICGEAANGADALKFIEEHRPDLVICDIRMPVMDGLELIRSVHERGMGTQFVVLSGYDDFRYVKEAIKYHVENYLLKPVNVDELRQTVHQVTKKLESELLRELRDTEGRESIKSNLLNRAVHHQISSYEFKSKLEVVDPRLRLLDSELRVAVIDFYSEGLGGHRSLPPETLQAIQRICATNLDPELAVSFMDYTGRVVVIFTVRDGTPTTKQIQNSLQAIYELSPGGSGVHWLLTVGNTVNSYKNLHVSYQNALHIQQYHFYYREGDVIFYEDIMAKRNPGGVSVTVDYFFIEDALKGGRRSELTGYLEACFERLSLKDTDPGAISTMVMEIVISMLRVLRAAGIPPAEIFDDPNRLLKTVHELRDMQKLQQWLHQKLNAALSALELRSKTTLSRVTKELVAYIDQHYHEDLSLKTLSRELHFNSVYMGRLFRNETGEVFSEYVNRIRIEKSKLHLQSPSSKINDVAKAVGFSNANYYCAIFKELTGMTPTEFRNQ
ncbi:response regulator transcription factor [Paenibacillus cremeus]|uniref:response regulator transcription factor n=1 Tax=Paenibacillus cremeus TaxID=2163881 RepID=UPI00164465EB|nr:response regulator transcription factor [Paenibacillus cremeus]